MGSVTEFAIIAGLAGVAVVVYLFIRRAERSAYEAEAYRGQNKAQADKIGDLQDKVLGDYAARDREDRLRAEEILRKRDAAGAAELLRDSTRDDFN